MIKQLVARAFWLLFAATLAGLANPAGAEESDPTRSAVNWASFERSGDLAHIWVTRTFAQTIALGHGTYRHRSQRLQYAIDCADRTYALEQWLLTDAVDGEGKIVWQDRAANLYFVRGDKGTLEAAVVHAACEVNPKSTVARNPAEAPPVQ